MRERELIDEMINEYDLKGGLMNGMERVVSLLRFENSPDVRE